MHDLSGTQIDRYTIQHELGQGGMAIVYLAHDTVLKREVALKILTPGMTSDADSVARFLREARAVSRLDHPNIVEVHDTGHAGDYYFIAMRFVDGCTLRQRLADGPLDPQIAREILTQIASALDCAHSHDVMHRDIKPENILIDRPGAALLTDFGIASAADELSVTVTGKVIGTPAYMAPELLRGEPASARSEIYALGIMAYELLTGTTPFAGRPAYAVMLAHLDERPQPLDRVRDDMSPAVAAVIDKALEKDPSARFSSAGEFASQLANALTDAPYALAGGQAPVPVPAGDAPTVVGERVRPPRAGQPSRRPGWLVFTSVGLLLGFVLIGVNALTGSDTSGDAGEEPEILAARRTPTPALPVFYQEHAEEPTDSSDGSAPEAEPVVEGVVDVDEPPAEDVSQQTDELDHEPPGDPPAQQAEEDGNSEKSEKDKSEKPEKEKQEKQEKPGGSDQAPGNAGDSPGNSGDAPEKKKNR